MDADDSSITHMMIPEDLIFIILLRLPVASLLRFKSVCKPWLSLIQSSAFVSQQILYNHHHHLLILEPTQTVRNSPCFSLTFTLLSDHLSRDFHFSPPPLDNPFRDPQIIATFNGLVFLKDVYATHHYLWNPATKQVRILPSPPFNPRDITDIYYGFGFDVETDDYKIVRLISEDFIVDRKPIKSRVEVYSLNADSWTDKTAQVLVPPNFVISSDPKSPFRNNQIYCWLGWDYVLNDSLHRKSILSFDFSNEVFRLIPVPDVYLVDFESTLTLAYLREQLACVDWVFDLAKISPHLASCKIWVLEESGVKESWTKLYTLVLDSPVFSVRSYIRGKIIWDPLPVNETANLCSCDPVTQELHSLPHRVEGGPLLLADYKESLVPVASRKGEPTNLCDSRS